MKWTFSGIEAQDLLGNDPEACLLDPVLVKENPVRKVFKCGKFFVKQDFRFFNGLKSEFRHAMQLEKHLVPCVKHLAVSRNMLITLAEENTVELGSFLRENTPSDAMLESFCGFIELMIKSGMRHTDLHSGNVLYDPEKNAFLLVDLRSASIPLKCFASKPDIYMHLAMELRRNLPKEKIYKLLSACKSSSPETDFDIMLNQETVNILASWKKRRQQILTGYRKFVRRRNDLIMPADAPEDISNAQIISGNGKDYLLLHHYLELNHIPHRKVWAVTDDKIYLAPMPAGEAPELDALSSDFGMRLALCGIPSTANDWVKTDNNLLFVNLQTALNSINLMEL